MYTKKILRLTVLILLFCVAALPAYAQAQSTTPPGTIQAFRIGHPTWTPLDFHQFSAPIGTASSGYAEFQTTQIGILPPPNHVWRPDLGIGPGAPHQPPYDQELTLGIASQGYHQGMRFSPAEFSSGMGVWVVWMVVPDPGTMGSSPDFASGPIIPNSLFPIHVKGVTLRDGKVWNPYVGEFDVPALDTNLNPPFMVDGHSHFPILFADNSDFGPAGTDIEGSYQFQITMTDNTGNGWKVVAHFLVKR